MINCIIFLMAGKRVMIMIVLCTCWILDQCHLRIISMLGFNIVPFVIDLAIRNQFAHVFSVSDVVI